MSELTYIFIGRVYPERAAVSFEGNTNFAGVGLGDDVPTSEVTVEISQSQITARMICPSPIKNIFTARNIVQDCAQTMLDALNFFHGCGFQMEITQVIPPSGLMSNLFIPQIPAVAEIVRAAGLMPGDIINLMNSSQQWHLRRALSDLCSAARSPVDTGFYCFRAIETLKNGLAHAQGADPESKKAWKLFREHYGVEENQIRRIQDFAKGPRHGNVQHLLELSDSTRAELFTITWQIVTTVMRAEKAAQEAANERKV
jgi:hypothetical protein